MAYGSVGAAFGGTGIEDAMLQRQKAQQEALMNQLAVQRAQSDLQSAQQNRELAKEAQKWAIEEQKAQTEERNQKVHDAKVANAIKRVPMAGMPWAPKLEQEFIELGLNPDEYRKAGTPGKPLSFGIPKHAPQVQDAQVAGLQQGAPAGLGVEVTPPEVLPAQEEVPAVSLGTPEFQRNQQIADLVKDAGSREEAAIALLQGGTPLAEIDTLLNSIMGPKEATAGALGEFRARAAMSPEERRAFDAYQDRDANRKVPTINVGTTDSRKERQIEARVTQYTNSPTSRRAATASEVLGFVESIDPKSKSPADHQGLIYAFAKAMDPDSAVREGEYDTVQRFAQDWLSTTGFSMRRIFEGSEILTPEAIARLKSTIRMRSKPILDRQRVMHQQTQDYIRSIDPGEMFRLPDIYQGGAAPVSTEGLANATLPPGVTVRRKK